MTHGGGLVCTRSDVEINYCRFTENQADDGGGLAICDSSPWLQHCTIDANTSSAFGGGLYIYDWNAGTSHPELVNCSVRGNDSNAGGGVFVWYDNTFDAFNTDILDNTATYGPDGSVNGDVYLTCCDVDLAQWSGNATVYLDNSDCEVDAEDMSWSAVKSMYR